MYIEGDVPVVTTGGNGNNGNGLMNGDGIWAIILFALIFGRNGYGGFGGYGGGGGGVGENYILATDFATIERKLDSISNGICDATFALNRLCRFKYCTDYARVRNKTGHASIGRSVGSMLLRFETRYWRSKL